MSSDCYKSLLTMQKHARKKSGQTRSSWLNCALRDDEAVYWVSVGPEVEFVHAVSAGGSVKFLSAV